MGILCRAFQGYKTGRRARRIVKVTQSAAKVVTGVSVSLSCTELATRLGRGLLNIYFMSHRRRAVRSLLSSDSSAFPFLPIQSLCIIILVILIFGSAATVHLKPYPLLTLSAQSSAPSPFHIQQFLMFSHRLESNPMGQTSPLTPVLDP